jgi:hypothetical protein
MPELLTEALQNDKDRGEHERRPCLPSPRPTRAGRKGKPQKRQAGLAVEIHITTRPRGQPLYQAPAFPFVRTCLSSASTARSSSWSRNKISTL